MAFRLILRTWLLGFSVAAGAQTCRVLDPELQGAYAGPCRNGLAEDNGSARGIAEYHGSFEAGRKHGRGIKLWPNGDRYEGEFFEDRKQGAGRYIWGRGPWSGESYEGAYSKDKRHGFGVYRFASGDVYAGPWEEDKIAGPATPMMIARGKFEEEARAAVSKEGQKVCRRVPVGIANEQWLRGVVVAVSDERVGVRIEEADKSTAMGTTAVKRGDVVWTGPADWIPCW